MAPIRIGYVPEHYLIPLILSQKRFGLDATLVPFPSGTGHMITALRTGELDLAIGLTEAWIAGLGRAIREEPQEGGANATAKVEKEGYRLVGGWVQSPLCWAVSVGLDRQDLTSLKDLKAGAKVGVSRLGSGSHIMSSVLAQDLKISAGHGKPEFEPVILNNLAGWRERVNSGAADFFMWEHYTTSSSWRPGADNRVKRIGEIYTPWPAWMIVASNLTNSSVPPTKDGEEIVEQTHEKLQKGVDYFRDSANKEEVISMILELDYSREDAEAWLNKTKFVQKVKLIDPTTVENTLKVLESARVLHDPETKELSSRYLSNIT